MALGASTWQLILDGAQFLLTGGVWLYVHLLQKRQATVERIEKLEGEVARRFEAHSERLARLEDSRSGAVQHADLEKIYGELRQISENVHKLDGRLFSTARVVEELLKKLLRE